MALRLAFLSAILVFTSFTHGSVYEDDDYPMCRLTRLDSAIIAGDADLVKHLISKGADVNKPNCNNQTPMDFAVYSNKSEMVSLLVENHANLTWMAINGRSYLDLAVFGKFGGSLRGLLQAGLPADLKDLGDETPLRLAVEYNYPEGAVVLAEFGADIHQRWGEKNITLLHLAAEKNSAGCIDFLVEKGLDVNSTDTNLWTPLHYASAYGAVWYIRVGEKLVQHGACINCNSTEGYTPLKVAQLYKNSFMELFLTENGATD